MNKHVIAAALIIGATGVFTAITNKTSISRVIIGAYVFLLILSILDFFGGPLDTIASALAMLAVLYVIFNQWSGIWNGLGTMLHIKGM